MSDTSDQPPREPRTAADRNELRTSRLADGNWLVTRRPSGGKPTTRRVVDPVDGGDEGV